MDTRLHWYFDNAFFLLMAIHSSDQTIEDPRKIFGVSTYEYNEALEPVKIQFYSNHGVLSPTLFLQFAKLVGFKENAPRLFSLLISLLATVFLFFTLRKVLNSNLLAFIFTGLYASMPLQLMYMDQMKYSNLEALLFFAFLFFCSQLNSSRLARILLFVISFLIFHSDYPIFMPTLGIAAYLLIRDEGLKNKHNFRRWFIFSIVAGISTALVIQWWLGFDPGKIVNVASIRMGLDQADLTTGKWLQKQWLFLLENFGEIHLFFMGGCLIWVLSKPSLLKNFWVYSGFLTFASTVLYLALFRNQSFIHHFLQWHLVTGYVLMLIGFAKIYNWGEFLQRNQRFILLVIPLFVLNFYQDYVLYKECRAPEFAKPQDILEIRGIDKRILYFADGTSGPVDWWNGPGIKLYKDPIFTGKKTPLPIATSENITYTPDRDLLAIIDNPKAIQYVSESINQWYPNFTLVPVQRSPSFIFFRLAARVPQ
ncbi:glycosyltransferase family 39 protein [bacterium]|nr:glycosyltransferase family 39 protein [bacterium]